MYTEHCELKIQTTPSVTIGNRATASGVSQKKSTMKLEVTFFRSVRRVFD